MAAGISGKGATVMDYRLEVAMVPTSDADKTKEFYQGLGWRLDADFDFGGGARVLQLTPPGSACSVSFGTSPFLRGFLGEGSTLGLEVVVDDIDAAKADMVSRGVEVSEVYHLDGGQRVPGAAPDHQSYGSYASFKDPDGNGYLLQEVTTRLPGRKTSALASYGSVASLADALRRASEAHGRHEAETGQEDPNWPDWYAQFMADDSAG
jgi:catechol 2,3-dioxygenase-like lactoylglutathione lyase family enzyme